ncbi:hypothetical protein GCM10009030_19760 [Haloarcula pellucida]|uniref:Uncharacterized protein n=1 Tax=Haloarcula pellucida TaxID=1427151 RepID=A0A830GKP0_9EURY|nr:hypothetical protein GCM10009030_19760 [Halomicroarcula pellucida]
MPDGYEYSGETNVQTSKLRGDTRERYASRDIVRQHARSFRRADDSTSPRLIYSEATVYQQASHAASQLRDIRDTFESNSGEIETVELASGVTGIQVTHTNDRGTKNTLIYYHTSNLVLLVITSGQDQFYPERTQKLLVKMISDTG